MKGLTYNGRVPNDPFREAFLRSPMTPGEIAGAVGWMRIKTVKGKRLLVADDSEVLRKLGLRHKTSNGRRQIQKTLSEEDAMKLLPLFPSLDPVDVGL